MSFANDKMLSDLAYDPETLTPAEIRRWLKNQSVREIALAREADVSYGFLRNVLSKQVHARLGLASAYRICRAMERLER